MSCKIEINPQYQSLEPVLQELPEKFDTLGELVYDQRNQVRLVPFPDGKTYAVKRFKKPMPHQRFDYTFVRFSKARRAYLYGIRFLQLGISTPTPVAYIEMYNKGIFEVGFFVSETCMDEDLRFLREEEGPEELLKSLVHFIMKMHKKGVLHGDLNFSNFLYREDASDPTGYHITTIDINRTKFVSHCTQHQCLKNLVRLTHVREVLIRVVRIYAEARGWDEQECVDFVIQHLEKFEKRKEIQHKLTGRK